MSLLGGDPWADAVAFHRRLAYVPGDVTLWPNLTGGEMIDLLGRLRGGLDARRRADLLERFELDPTKRARTYSKGNRQKVALVAALASDVELLVLDEPTSGLDPLMEAVFQRCVTRPATEGRTVLLSSHILAEVEALCDRVSIIRAGRTVETGTLADLRHLTRTSIGPRPSAATGLDDLAGVHDLVVEGHRVRFDVDPSALDGAHRAHGRGFRTLVSQPPSLEELFLRHYGDELAAATADGAGGRQVGSGAWQALRSAAGGSADGRDRLGRRDRLGGDCCLGAVCPSRGSSGAVEARRGSTLAGTVLSAGAAA